MLLFIFHAAEAEFRTAWFIESVISASLVVLVIRTRRSIFRSTPSWKLLIATLVVVAAVMVLPFTPLRGPLGFAGLRPVVFAVIGAIIATYVLAAEVVKWLFYRAESRTGPGRGQVQERL